VAELKKIIDAKTSKKRKSGLNQMHSIKIILNIAVLTLMGE